MKKLFRGDILSWIDTRSGQSQALQIGDLAGRASQVMSRAAAGTIAYAEPFLEQVVSRVAGIDKKEDREEVHRALEEIREELKKPRAFSRELWPFAFVQEHSVILPQNNLLQVTDVTLCKDDEFIILARDFRRPTESLEEGKPRYVPFWRLLRYNQSSRLLDELGPIPRPSEEQPKTVAICADQSQNLWLLCGDRVYRLDDAGALEEIFTFEFPNPNAAVNNSKLIAVREEEIYVGIEEHEDEILLYCFEKNGQLSRELGYVGNMVDQLVVSEDDRLITSNLFEVKVSTPFGATVTERDLKPYFDEYGYTGVEMVVASGPDRLFLSNGKKLLELARDPDTVLEEYLLPHDIVALLMVDDLYYLFSTCSVTKRVTIAIYSRQN